MNLDIEIATEISSQISEHGSKSKSNPNRDIKSVIARRKQSRATANTQSISDDEAVNMLSKLG